MRKGWKIGWKRRGEKGRENEHVRRKECQVGWRECGGCKYVICIYILLDVKEERKRCKGLGTFLKNA